MFKNYELSANSLSRIIILFFTAVVIFFMGCGGSPKPATENAVTEGAVLSRKYCTGCHQYPNAALLDKVTWERGVLPAMAKQLGIQQEMGQYYADSHTIISMADWQKIIAFYKKAAPAKLTLPKSTAVKDWAIFKLKTPAVVNRKKGPAMITMIRYNRFNHLLYTGDATGSLYSWDAGLHSKLVTTLPSGITDAAFSNNASSNTGTFTCIGVLPPNDFLKGSLVKVALDSKKARLLTLSDSLPRPVQTAAADFNRDGLTDYMVCGFGNTKGGLYLVQQQPDHSFKKRIIRQVPGAIQVISGDFNNDGWPDAIVLFAQADEGIWMFLNDKKGGFSTRNLLHFPPVYGSNSFQLADMDHDGKLDIVYTCGDNSDYSNILKPYHGVYIFTNTGNWNFKQTFFYHINGCSKAVIADFNADGKPDIATIAFFADFKFHPTESFIYLQQASANKFISHEVPVNRYGRWIAMEVADINGDGLPDVVLGNFSIFAGQLINQKDYRSTWDLFEPIILLQNISKK